jgi:hypothetical protein
MDVPTRQKLGAFTHLSKRPLPREHREDRARRRVRHLSGSVHLGPTTPVAKRHDHRPAPVRPPPNDEPITYERRYAAGRMALLSSVAAQAATRPSRRSDDAAVRDKVETLCDDTRGSRRGRGEASISSTEALLNKWWMIGVLSGFAVLGTASRARAEGFELGARLGYGIPMGEVADDGDLSDGISGMIPLQLDLGYRVLPELMIGGYVMYGFGFTGDTISDSCDRLDDIPGVTASCSTHDLRLGIQAQYHFLPQEKLDPWLGLGVGYEWLTFGTDIAGGGSESDVSFTARGFEFLNLQGGLDFEVADSLALGPFLSFSIAQYGERSSSCSGNACMDFDSTSEDIDDKALHQWLLLGIRGTFVLGGD